MVSVSEFEKLVEEKMIEKIVLGSPGEGLPIGIIDFARQHNGGRRYIVKTSEANRHQRRAAAAKERSK